MAFCIERGEALHAAIVRVAGEQFAAAERELARVARCSDRSVHEVRKRCKKLRGLLRLIRPGMDAALFREADSALREAANALGDTRDAAVHEAIMEDLGGSGIGGQAAAPDRAALAEEAGRGMASARSALTRWVAPDDLPEALIEGFRRTYRRCRRALQAADAEPTDENFHQLRKWVKYHWYQVRLLHKRAPESVRRHREALREIGELLGDAHDLANLERTASGSVRNRARRNKTRYLRKARRKLGDVLRRTPRKMARKLRASFGA